MSLSYFQASDTSAREDVKDDWHAQKRGRGLIEW